MFQAGCEELHPDRDPAEDPGQKSRSETAAQSARHRAVWTAARSVADVTGNSAICVVVCSHAVRMRL